MTNRREFLEYSGAAAIVAFAPPGVLADEHAQMMTRKLPGTNESLSVIGLGNARPFNAGDLELSRALLDIFMARGGGYVDTSGQGRFTVGQIMAERQAHGDLFLGTYIDGKDLAAMREEIRSVQDAQGGGELDLVMTRAPKDFMARRDQFQQLRDDGLTRHLGVARPNQRFYPEMMDLMNAGAVDLVQLNYSMMEPGAADEILPLAMEKEIAVIINRPFINGDYFGMVRGQELPAWAAEFDCESWAQFSLKFILAHPAVNCVITETSNPEHAIDNLAAGSGRLPDKETQQRMRKVIQGFM